ncbi:41058_t:CDS:2 [Gigaspora margarita]|uniref:41058_t:CDS:1 n=1 Tax=Gigaspora margarita TaxID=4874 RepID=A0ABM8VXP9_GIGMA|nr:41058_t:CDS:2 [Gigaspora margarita]
MARREIYELPDLYYKRLEVPINQEDSDIALIFNLRCIEN